MVLNLDGLEVEQIQRPKHDYETTVVFGSFAGNPVVLKTFQFHPPLFRWLLGWLCRREARLLALLAAAPRPGEGRAWLPEGARQWGRWGVLMPRVEGRPIREVRPGELPSEFIRRLESAVAIMHREKVVHLDLKNGGNILVRDGEFPVVLDFAGCISFRRWWFFGGLMTRLLGRVDRAAILKWKREFFPESLAPEERRFLERMERMRRWWPFPIRKFYRRGKVRVSPPLVETSPVETPPVETPPVETPPVETPETTGKVQVPGKL